jgi:CRISPR/Cas system CSM-associated protein Csm2 small subunit
MLIEEVSKMDDVKQLRKIIFELHHNISQLDVQKDALLNKVNRLYDYIIETDQESKFKKWRQVKNGN